MTRADQRKPPQSTDAMTTLDLGQARRSVVEAALLAAPTPKPGAAGVMTVVRGLGRLQIDPTRTVEKTHLLVLWSRLGSYDRGELDSLLWTDRSLFEYRAFVWPIESLPEARFLMQRFPSGHGAWQRRVGDWLAANGPASRRVLARLGAEGPLPSRAFADEGPRLTHWPSGGWTDGRNVTQLFEFLHGRGDVMIAGRQGNGRIWGLPDQALPADAPTEPLTPEAFVEHRVLAAVGRLGVATQNEIIERVPYTERSATLSVIARLAEDGRIERVDVERERSFMVAGASAAAADGAARSRTTLLSPFDPLVKDRDRTERIFGFQYRLEMYVPKAERKFGHFVLPILHGHQLIGRIDPLMDRRAGVLRINAVHAEPDAPVGAGAAVGRAIRDLAGWLGAREVAMGEVAPVWKRVLGG